MSAPDGPPLAGVRVLDLSRILAGPFAAQLLADLGAAVHKVEPPGGDATRTWGPPFEQGDRGESAYFRCANRGKRSEVLDLHDAAGRTRLDALLAEADVVVENFTPPVARRLGLGPADLRAHFPRLIVASVRAFADDVPARDRPGYDFLLQAESGWMAITGEPGGRPMKVGVALVDVLAALYLANGIQAALRRRDRTGLGMHVEVPLMEAALAGLVNVGASVLMTGVAPRRFGNAHPNIVPYQAFTAADGEVAIAVGNDRDFAALLEVLGLGDALAENPHWTTNPGRVGQREGVIGAIQGVIGGLSVADVLERCSRCGIPAGPVRTPRDALLDQEGVLHRAIHRLQDPAAPDGSVAVVGTPILLDGRRACSTDPPPRGAG